MADANFANWSRAPGASVPPLEGLGASLRRVEVPAGHVAQRHSHAHEQSSSWHPGGERYTAKRVIADWRLA